MTKINEKLIDTIRWDNVSGNSYLYGSSIQVRANRTIFKNPRMASGTVIQSWHSKVNFQGSRTTAQLPLLIPGTSYRLVPHVETIPEKRIYYRISFFNRQEEEITFFVNKTGDVEDFVCPEGTYTYKVQLISAGCREVDFESLKLYQIDHLQEATSGLSQTQKRAYYQDDIFPIDLQFIAPLIRQDSFSKETNH